MAQAFREHRKTQFRRKVVPLSFGTVPPNDCGRFRPGDILFVQEAFRVRSGCAVQAATCCEDLAYRCDFPFSDPAYFFLDWQPAHMMGPHLSRTTLLVEDVRVQRVQDIADADARAEGVVLEYRDLDGPPVALIPGSDIEAETPRAAYAKLWDALQGPGAWERNGWVYAVTVRTVHQNVNCLLHGG